MERKERNEYIGEKRNHLLKVKDECYAFDSKRLIHHEKVKSIQVKEKEEK